MPRFHRHRLDNLIYFGVALVMTATCLASTIWCVWQAMTGTPDERVRASYAFLVTGSAGVITFVTTELLRPWRR